MSAYLSLSDISLQLMFLSVLQKKTTKNLCTFPSMCHCLIAITAGCPTIIFLPGTFSARSTCTADPIVFYAGLLSVVVTSAVQCRFIMLMYVARITWHSSTVYLIFNDLYLYNIQVFRWEMQHFFKTLSSRVLNLEVTKRLLGLGSVARAGNVLGLGTVAIAANVC